MKLCIILLLVVLLFPFYSSYSYGDANKVIYELQERCGKVCADEFRRIYGEGVMEDKDGTTVATYLAHYNAKLNKCFYLKISSYLPKDDKKKSFRLKDVLDINENRPYGSFSKVAGSNELFVCYVGKIKCHSEKEWDELIRPYMEE